MRWVKIGLLVIVLLLLTSSSVLADTSGDVTVSATGYICEAPGEFTLTYISDYEVGISWTKGADAENTMVRAAYGRTPENRTDGYLVYYGDGTNASDTGVNLDETFTPVYYIAFSQNAGGAWEELGISDNIEGVSMTIFAIVAIILALMAMGFIFKNGILFLASSLGWVLFAFLMFSKAFDNAAMNTGLLLFGGAMAIVTAVLALRMIMAERPRRMTLEDEQRAFAKQVYDITNKNKRK